MAGLLPLWGTASEYEAKIDLLKKRVEIQQVALPLYQDLKRRLEVKAPQGLPFPTPAKISRDGIGQLKSTLQEMAERSKLTALLIDPDLAALVKGAPRIAVVTELRGDLFDFRKYLIALNGLSYVTETVEMQIRQTAQGTVFMLKFYLDVN